MLRSWVLVIGTCLAVAVGLGYYKYAQIRAAMAFAAAFPEPVMTVRAALATEALWQPAVSVSGEVVATRSVELSNELPGRIVAVGFEAGARVAAGDVLVALDTSEENAQLAAARAEVEIARLDLTRNQKLIASGAAAQEARDRAQARYDGAVAAVDRLLAVIQKKTLRAPFDAITGLHELEAGQYLDKAAAITRLIGIADSVWVDFTLPQQQAAIAIGEVVRISAPGFAEALNATIIARDAFVNERSRNVGFRALVTDPERRLLPGALVNVSVPVAEQQTATTVPITAVRQNAFGASVFVLVPAEEPAAAPYRAERRPVTLGAQQGESIIIASGLVAGEQVAADGAFKLREGVLVNVPAGPAGIRGG